MARSNEQGMITFDQYLFQLFEDGLISYDEAVRNADSQNELRLHVQLESTRARENLLEDPAVKTMRMRDDDAATLITLTRKRVRQGKSVTQRVATECSRNKQ